MRKRKSIWRFGDLVESGLRSVGITKERVVQWLRLSDEDCGCTRRKRKLNQLGQWAEKFFTGTSTPEDDPQEELENLIGE